MIENEKVKKAEEELEYLSGDEAERRIAYLRETAEIDRKFAMTAARDQGRAEGRSEGKIDVAKKMLEKNMDISLIIEVTGLTKEEIETAIEALEKGVSVRGETLTLEEFAQLSNILSSKS